MALKELYKCFYKWNSLGKIAFPRQGLATSNNDKYLRLWYEVAIEKIKFDAISLCDAEDSRAKWFPHCKGGSYRKWYGNREYVINWENNGTKLRNDKKAVIRNSEMYFHSGVSYSDVSTGKYALRYYGSGFVFDSSGPMIFLNSNNVMYNERKLLALMNSTVANSILSFLCPTIHYTQSAVAKVPLFEVKYLCKEVDNCVNISKCDWDSFETSWDFKKHPLVKYASFTPQEILKDGGRRISDMGLIRDAYELWRDKCEGRFNQLKANEKELNRIFIEIYGLQDELTPEVEDKDVTVRKADLQRDIKSLISYAVGCMFGRYSLDEEGLVLAGQPFESHFFEASAPVCGIGFAGAPGASVPIGEFYYKTDDGVKKCTYNPDKDNIIPICDEEYFSDDIVSRFCEWVKIVYGEKSLETNLDFIAKALGNKGNTSREVIRNYFLNDFFKDHCNTYSVTGSGKRPIYWLFDSGKQNGFKALIYMHRYDADTVGRVRTDYLHKAQKYVETAMQSAQYTIDNATSASEKSKATKAVTKYTKQLAEMKIYDEAIAHVANQRIEIDLDDGVKVNYEKFQGVEVAQEGKKALKVDLLAKI